MNESRQERISALIDDELDDAASKLTLDDLTTDLNQRLEWERYHLIGATLRGEQAPALSRDFAFNVMERVRKEHPPRRLPWLSGFSLPSFGRLGWSPFLGAATVASTLIAAVLLLRPTSPTPFMAMDQPAGTPLPAQTVSSVALPESVMREYLVNHAEYAALNGVQGSMPYARLTGYELR